MQEERCVAMKYFMDFRNLVNQNLVIIGETKTAPGDDFGRFELWKRNLWKNQIFGLIQIYWKFEYSG